MTHARAFHSAATPQFPGLAQKTYAPRKIWKGSITTDFKFVPVAKKQRRDNQESLEAWRNMPDCEGIKPRCLKRVFWALGTFYNNKTGALYPSIDAIARVAEYGRRQTQKAIAWLDTHGLIGRQLRAGEVHDERGHFVEMEQQTNAYWLNPRSQWVGYKQPPANSPPANDAQHPIEWGRQIWGGAAAPLGVAAGDGARAIQAKLEGSPDNPLAVRLASMGARLLATVSRSV